MGGEEGIQNVFFLKGRKVKKKVGKGESDCSSFEPMTISFQLQAVTHLTMEALTGNGSSRSDVNGGMSDI